MTEEKFVCHSDKQERLIFSDSNETYAITGIQWAKTTSGAWWMKRQMFQHTDSEDNFIIAAPTYKIMQQSTLPAFLRIMDGFGNYRAGDAVFEMHGGGTVFMRTGTEPDSVVGITNVRATWGDEAGKYSRYFWENIKARASFKQAPKLFTSTPYAMNWMYKEVLKPYKEGRLEDTLVIQAKSSDNPYFPKEEYERQKRIMDPRRFNAMYNGEFEKMHGLVYDAFDELENICEPTTLPIGTKYYAGVDWGTTHPFVIVVHAVTPLGVRFQVSEFYKRGYGITNMVQVAQKLKQVWGIQMFWCDPSQPGLIQEFNRSDLPAGPAINDIRLGIDRVYPLIKERNLKFFSGANNFTLSELETYHYEEPKDLGPNDKDKEQMPVDQDNHCMDAMRYCVIMTSHSHEKKAPHVPGLEKRQETNADRIARLKKGKSKKTETWS